MYKFFEKPIYKNFMEQKTRKTESLVCGKRRPVPTVDERKDTFVFQQSRLFGNDVYKSCAHYATLLGDLVFAA